MMSRESIDWVTRANALNLQVRNFVGGSWTSGPAGERLRKYSPRDGKLLTEFGAGQPAEVDECVANAREAFEDGRWSDSPLQQRKSALIKLASLIEQHREELALLESVDVGKPISDALNFDIPAAADFIRFNAEALDKIHGKVYAVDRSSLSYELRRPMGVAAGIVGWNFPLYLAARKIGPTLAAGNCLVLKPSEFTPFSAARVAELAIEAGVPPGVFNVIHGGPAVGAALAAHPDVDVLTFTGSSRTGKRLLIAAGESNMKRLVLECGGKAPNIVFADCPKLEAVADAIVARAFWNQGEVCSASSRLLVERSIKDELLDLVVKRAASLQPADPLHPDARFGALVNQDHQRKVLSYIESGSREGARMVHQSTGSAPFANGFYVPATVFDEVSSGHQIAQEEIFGPVLSVISFRDEEEAIRIANSTIYGLTAIAWTRDLGRAHRVSQRIHAGSTVVYATETPKGGPGVGVLSVGGHKESGIGVEGGLEGLEHYMSKTAVQFFV